MRVFEQLQKRRGQLGKTLGGIAKLTGISVPQVSNVLAGKVDARGSTYEALSEALNARLVLVPKHLLPEVNRLLSGKPIGPDDVPTAVERFLGA